MADILATGIDLAEPLAAPGAFAYAAEKDGPAKVMMRALAAAALGALLAACQPSAPEAAQVEQAAAPKSGEPDVGALMEAIASRNEARARELVGDVGYLVVPKGLISSEDELLDRVLGCQVEDLTTANAVVKYRVVWKCPPAGGGEPVYYNARSEERRVG